MLNFSEYAKKKVPELLFPEYFIQTMFKLIIEYGMLNKNKWINIHKFGKFKIILGERGNLIFKCRFSKGFTGKFNCNYAELIANSILKKEESLFTYDYTNENKNVYNKDERTNENLDEFSNIDLNDIF